MKLSVKADIELEVQLKDVLAFLEEEKIESEYYDKIIQTAMRKKKGFFTLEDQAKLELFEKIKERYTALELEALLK